MVLSDISLKYFNKALETNILQVFDPKSVLNNNLILIQFRFSELREINL